MNNINKQSLQAWFRAHSQSRLGRDYINERFVAKKTALVVVDMQNYFMADGQFGCCPVARDIVPNVNRLAQALRAAGGHVVWIQNAAPAETLENWANLHEMYSPENKQRRLEGLTRDC